MSINPSDESAYLALYTNLMMDLSGHDNIPPDVTSRRIQAKLNAKAPSQRAIAVAVARNIFLKNQNNPDISTTLYCWWSENMKPLNEITRLTECIEMRRGMPERNIWAEDVNTDIKSPFERQLLHADYHNKPDLPPVFGYIHAQSTPHFLKQLALETLCDRAAYLCTSAFPRKYMVAMVDAAAATSHGALFTALLPYTDRLSTIDDKAAVYDKAAQVPMMAAKELCEKIQQDVSHHIIQIGTVGAPTEAWDMLADFGLSHPTMLAGVYDDIEKKIFPAYMGEKPKEAADFTANAICASPVQGAQMLMLYQELASHQNPVAQLTYLAALHNNLAEENPTLAEAVKSDLLETFNTKAAKIPNLHDVAEELQTMCAADPALCNAIREAKQQLPPPQNA